MTNSAVLVLLYVTDPADAPGSAEAAYHEVSVALDATPGLVGNTLLRGADDPRQMAVLSEWTDLQAFRAWESGSTHRDTTAALRPLQDSGRGQAFAIYEVVASYTRGGRVL
jgi:heme-degrading monooxygenase HmoA